MSVADSDAVVIAGLAAPRDPGELADLERDVVELTAQERSWPRRRMTTRAGRVLTLMLPSGETLAPGCLLHVGPGWYVEVEAAPEQVLAVSPRSAREAIRLALEAGQRHSSIAVDGDQLLVPDDPSMERLLWKMGVPWTRERRPFIPVGTGTPH